MRAILLPAAGLALGLALAGCTDAGDPTVTPPTSVPDSPHVAARLQLPQPVTHDISVIVTSTGPGTAGMIVEGPGGESRDLALDVGERGDAFDHTFELLQVDGDLVRLEVTGPTGGTVG